MKLSVMSLHFFCRYGLAVGGRRENFLSGTGMVEKTHFEA